MTFTRNPLLTALYLLGILALLTRSAPGQASATPADDFSTSSLSGWRVRDGKWSVRDGRAHAEGGLGVLLREKPGPRDFELSADVGYRSEEPFAAAGLVFRFREDFTGYAVCLREVEHGVDARFGPWERPVLQLFRLDPGGWKLLQESKVLGCQSGTLNHVRVVCRGPAIWVFYADGGRPVLTEYDADYVRGGAVGLLKDQVGSGQFDNFVVTAPGAAPGATPDPPLRTDWSTVRGAVYVRSDAVNAVQMWDDYWPHTGTMERELSYAHDYGFNMVQVYLHWIVWDHYGAEYLRRIDDFLARAARHGLRANLIFWDDCGSVQPSLTVAPPIPGRHNSQMMPNPAHAIRDSTAELTAHRERFRTYVHRIAERFKDDPRIAFWQLYNEGMGPKEQYRTGNGDANLCRLLEWTRGWVKETGTHIPVTATGGGFYGPQYSDFYTYHSYRFEKSPLPNTEGGPEHLCTETLNRPDTTLRDCVREFGAHKNGFVVWELMIGRDNCRFPWGHPDGRDEPTHPFHGVVYPDGHPWDVEEIKAMLGEARFASLQRRVFKVEYFDEAFGSRKKVSITPRIDFNLGDEPGTGSPDASAGVPRNHFSVRWKATLRPPRSGAYEFSTETDGVVRLWVGSEQVPVGGGKAAVRLEAGTDYPLKVEYEHGTGSARCRLFWEGPEAKRRVLTLQP